MHNTFAETRGHHNLGTRTVLRLLFLGTLCLLLTGFSSCGGFFVDPVLNSVTVSPSSPSVSIGKTVQLTAVGHYDDGTTSTLHSVSWSSSDADVASVSSSGLVTGVSAGTATITAGRADKSGTTTVMVTLQNVESITVGPTTSSIRAGDIQPFTATAVLNDGTSIDATNAVTWKSSDTTTAKIASNGVAVGEPVSSTKTTLITATSGSITSKGAVLTVSP